MTPAAFRKLALSKPNAVELPHFDRTSFRVGKRIFATMTRDGKEVMVPVRPLVRCFELLGTHPEMFFSYGGWTQRFGSLGVRLATVDVILLSDLLQSAWARVSVSPTKGRKGAHARSKR